MAEARTQAQSLHAKFVAKYDIQHQFAITEMDQNYLGSVLDFGKITANQNQTPYSAYVATPEIVPN